MSRSIDLLFDEESLGITYRYREKFYSSHILIKYNEDISDFTVLTSVQEMINNGLTSQPIFLLTSDNNWFIITDNNNQLKIIVASDFSARRKRIKHLQFFNIPDLNRINPDVDYDALPILNLPSSERLYLFLKEKLARYDHFSLSNLDKREIVPSIYVPEGIDIWYGPTWYIAPIIMKSIDSYFISLDQINELLQNNQIESFLIDSVLQGYTNSPNTILTFFARNGKVYLVEAQYNIQTNEMFAPI